MRRSIAFLCWPKNSKESKPQRFTNIMTDDDLVAKYAAEAKKSMKKRRKSVEEVIDPIYEAKLRANSLFVMLDSEDLVPALLARLGSVRAALDGHGGGISRFIPKFVK